MFLPLERMSGLKKIQWVFAIVLAFSLVSASPSFAAEKSLDRYFIEDVPKTHSAYVELERFLFADWIDGYVTVDTYEDGGEVYEFSSVKVKPSNPITRAQFTKILVNALNLQAGVVEKTFSDVKRDDWHYKYVQIATSQGIIKGYSDGTFKPNKKITRAQMASMIVRAFEDTVDFSKSDKSFKDVTTKNSAREAISKAATVGIVKGYGENFKPNQVANRSQAVLMIDRAMHLEQGNTEDEAAILTVVERNIKEELALMAGSTDAKALEKLYRETTTGYLLASSLEGNALFGDLEDPELEMSITLEQIGQHTTSISSINKRLAVVSIDNLVVKMSVIDPDMSFTMNMDISGLAFLKKMADGSWKIYHIHYDDDDFNLQ